ncbi:hypothetical protein EYF80_037739 [Liparis tanakae]|uniref:Uncharacterized protein n=1 Tax=Liparis tanakae TaxID=230148 RepID=A0A4Z2GH06_9TELE|nr:hypothetical protein EYF80_037739 [Liparis tanakae]
MQYVPGKHPAEVVDMSDTYVRVHISLHGNRWPTCLRLASLEKVKSDQMIPLLLLHKSRQGNRWGS